MPSVPNPFRSGPGAERPVATGPPAPGTDNRRVVGGRHGSPTVQVAFPFSKIESIEEDPALRQALAELADLVGRLAEAAAAADADTLAGVAAQAIALRQALLAPDD